MNKQLKSAILVWMLILLSACGQLESVSAPVEAPELVVSVTDDPNDTSDPAATSESVEISQTAAPVKGLASEKVIQYVGISYPPLPAGLSEGFSMTIQDSNGYGLTLVMDGADNMLWLEKPTHYDADGRAYWQIVDVLELPKLDGEVFLIPDACFLNDSVDNGIITVAKDGKVVSAWRVNMSLNVFQVISTDGVRCDSDKAWRLN